MRNRILFPILLFIGWLPLLAIQKPLFMLYNWEQAAGCTAGEWLQVVLHGLKLDCTIAGYLTALPLLATLVSTWLPGTWLRRGMKAYFGVIAVLISLIFIVDVALYPYWGFRLDSTLLFYLESPKDAMASVPVWMYFTQGLFFLLYTSISYVYLRTLLRFVPTERGRRPALTTVAMLLLGGLMFIPIRGGVTTSTANVGMVYFSRNQFLNHSAINPCFSLIASLSKQQDFAAQFDFFPEEKRKEIVGKLYERPDSCRDIPTRKVLNTTRPNILILLMESFSANTIEVLGGEPGVTPNLNRLSREGILFSNAYANSFRTDRGTVAILNGYLAQPTTSIMKYPAKSQTLPSIAKSLGTAGYRSEMLYGGDINFTNMQSYFYSSGYSAITSDKDFPLTDRLSKWGANDDVTFHYLYNVLSERKADAEPWMTTFLTLSSHEPFEVPYHRLEDPYLNSVAFTDSCFGAFIDKIRETPVWDNLLIVLVADHGYRYPHDVKEYEPRRYHVPILWLGGAVEKAEVVETYCSQTDIAATLLGQLELPHEEFTFSKDIFSCHGEDFCFYTFINGFGMLDKGGYSVYDNEGNHILVEEPGGSASEERIAKGKALLQTLYDDLGSR